MKYGKLIILAVLTVFATSSCKTAYELLLEGNDIDAKYEAAFDYFNNGKYPRAAQLFESLSVATSGTPQDDTVQYYWGLSNYRYRDYYTAEANFENFINNYPRSPFSENAAYLRIDCLFRSTLRYELDQAPSAKALAAIGEYLTDHPDTPHLDICNLMIKELGDRMDRKAYESARLYYKMEDYLASRIAFKNILKDDADNIYREDILYYAAMSSYKYAKLSVPEKQKTRYLTFLDDYYNFVGEYPESTYRREMDALYKRAQKSLGRDVAEDDDEGVSEKEFKKLREEE